LWNIRFYSFMTAIITVFFQPKRLETFTWSLRYLTFSSVTTFRALFRTPSNGLWRTRQNVIWYDVSKLLLYLTHDIVSWNGFSRLRETELWIYEKHKVFAYESVTKFNYEIRNDVSFMCVTYILQTTTLSIDKIRLDEWIKLLVFRECELERFLPPFFTVHRYMIVW